MGYNSNMKILVTGAAGYIGSDLSEYLLEKGHTVVGVDNFNKYYSTKVKEYNLKEFKDNPKFKLYKIDLLDAVAVKNMFDTEESFDCMVHLAAWAGVPYSYIEPVTYVRHNIEATTILLEEGIKHNSKNIIFASTSSVYGSNVTPFVENMTTDRPLAPYPATKKAVEVMLHAYMHHHKIKATILRFFNPLGPRLRPDLAVTSLIRSCLYGTVFEKYDGTYKMGRDYTYIQHMLEAIERIAANPFDYEIFNFGNSAPVMLPELIQTVEEVVGKKANIILKPTRAGEMELTFANIDKAKKMIGYNPTTSIKEIVKMYYNWFVQQEDWYKKGQY